MSEKIDPAGAGGAESQTWREVVRAFEADAVAWLTPTDGPQVKALYAIAEQLDRGKIQAALVSQFTLVHRNLLSRGQKPGGGAESDDDNPDDDPDILDLWGRRDV